MKKALISTIELRQHFDGSTGCRVAQVEPIGSEFPVAEGLYWMDCNDEVTTDWTYVDGKFIAPIIPIPTADQNKATASSLLFATDWTTFADVANPQVSTPYLANQAEFIAYRNVIRQIAVYPVAGDLVWAIVPVENWVKV